MTSPWQPPGPPIPPSEQNPQGAPPAPEPRAERPRYGEYAPEGYVSPVPAPEPVAVQPAQPTPYQMPPYQAPGNQPVYAAVAPIVRTAKTPDIVITCVLLFAGLIGMLFGIAAPSLIPAVLLDEYHRFDVPYRHPANLGVITMVMIISHLVLYVIALGVSILLMVRRRIAFWVPLVAGIIAAVLFWGLFFALLASDPALLNAMGASA